MEMKTRKAISPVLATVILIAITLVAGVAIAGFAFGLFTSLSATANIRVLSADCNHAGTFSVVVTNTGAGAGTITGVTPSTLTVTSVTVPANTAGQTISGTGTFASGQTITGSFMVSGGSTLPFTATCS